MAAQASTDQSPGPDLDLPCLHTASTLPAFAVLGDADELARHYARVYGAYRAARAA
jgi:hypothetical protein